MAAPQRIGTFAIVTANDASNSTTLSRDDFGRCRALSIQSLDAALTGVCTLQVNSKQDGTGVWTTVQSPPGTDVTVAALKAVTLLGLPYALLRIHSAGVEIANRNFEVWGTVGE